MCQVGFNSADYKLAIHQLTEQTRVLKTSSEAWARLAGSVNQLHLSQNLLEASTRMAEAISLLEAAMDDAHHHTHENIEIH